MLFVVGLVAAVPVFVEVDGDDLGVVDVEVVSTLKYNTNNYVANWSPNFYPWVLAIEEFNGNVQYAWDIQAKMRYENRLFSISFDFFKILIFENYLEFLYSFHLKKISEN